MAVKLSMGVAGLFPIAALLLLTSFENVNGEDSPKFTCVNGTLSPTPELKAKLGKCYDPSVHGTEEGKKDPKCAAYCFTEAVGGLKDGLPSKELFEALVNSEFPEGEKKTGLDKVAFCFEQHGSVDVKDEKCVDIAAFSTCATNFITKTACS